MLAFASSSRFIRRLVLFLLGVWLGAMLLVALMVPLSFSSIDVSMVDPPKETARLIQAVGPLSLRMVLRHQIAEANRAVFSELGLVQILLGAIILGLHVFALPVQKLSIALAATMTALSAAMKFFLVPRIQELSIREMAPSVNTVPDRDAFQFLYQGFAAFEAAIVILGLVLVWNLFQRRERPSGPPVLDAREDLLPPLR